MRFTPLMKMAWVFPQITTFLRIECQDLVTKSAHHQEKCLLVVKQLLTNNFYLKSKYFVNPRNRVQTRKDTIEVQVGSLGIMFLIWAGLSVFR